MKGKQRLVSLTEIVNGIPPPDRKAGKPVEGQAKQSADWLDVLAKKGGTLGDVALFQVRRLVEHGDLESCRYVLDTPRLAKASLADIFRGFLRCHLTKEDKTK